MIKGGTERDVRIRRQPIHTGICLNLLGRNREMRKGEGLQPHCRGRCVTEQNQLKIAKQVIMSREKSPGKEEAGPEQMLN